MVPDDVFPSMDGVQGNTRLSFIAMLLLSPQNRLRLTAVLITIFFVSAFGSNVNAQSDLPTRLDLKTAVDRAVENDPQISGTRAVVRIAEAKITEAKAARMPSVQLGQSITRSNNPVFVFGSLLEQGRFTSTNFALDALNRPNGLTNFRSVIDVKLPVFDQWKTRSRISRAGIERDRADLQTELIGQRLRFEIIRTYFGAVLADELLKATDAAVSSAKENSRNAKNMVEVGMVAESDSLVADVELARVQQQHLEAESVAFTTRAALNIAIGNEPNVRTELAGNLFERYFPSEEQDELIRIAKERRPDYQQAQLAVDDNREQTRTARNERLPRVDAFASVGYSSPYVTNGSSDYTVGVNLSYTLFDPGRKARIAQSTFAESASQSEKDRLANQITLEVITALQNYRTSRSKILVSIKAVTQAEEARRILRDRYHSALSTFEAVLSAEASVLRAKHDLFKARYEYYVGYASILLATGRLNDVSVFN